MKRVLLCVAVVSIPCLLFLNVWHGFRYERLADAVVLLEDEQQAWYEQNKHMVAAITIYESPKRIHDLAIGELGLKEIDESHITRLRIGTVDDDGPR